MRFLLHLVTYALVLTCCSAPEVEPAPPPPSSLPSDDGALVRQAALNEARAKFEAALARRDATTVALAEAEEQASGAAASLAQVEAEQHRLLQIAALPVTYTIMAQVTSFDRGAVFAFGMAMPDEGSPEAEGAVLNGTIVLVDPRPGDLVAMRSQLVAGEVYFRGRISCVNGYGRNFGCNAYSHTASKATAAQAAARKRLAVLQVQRDDLRARIARLAEARRAAEAAAEGLNRAEAALPPELR